MADISEVVSNETENIPVLIKEEIEYDITELRKIADDRITEFNRSQSLIFYEVLDAVKNQQALCQFIYAWGGTGKTLVLNAILATGKYCI